MYTDDDPTYWKTVYGATGALQKFVEADKRAPVGGFVSQEVYGSSIGTWLKSVLMASG